MCTTRGGAAQHATRPKASAKGLNQRRPLETTAPGEVISADTIAGCPRSTNGLKNIFHIHCVASDYGMAWPIRDEVVSELALYWLRRAQGATGRPAKQFRVDSGEAKTTAVLTHCLEQGTDVVTNLANVHSNETIERRHRTLQKVINALSLNQGQAGGNLCMGGRRI